MTGAELWLGIFILGVVVFMVGTLIPHRTVTVVGAIAAAVGGIGWLVLALD